MFTKKRNLVARLIMMATIITMLLSFYSGCQPAKKEADKKGEDASTVSTAKDEKKNFNETGYPIVDEEITVRSMISEAPMYIPDDPDEVLYWKELRKLTNIHIKWDFPENDATAINLYFAAGDLPDFFIKHLDANKVYEYGIKGDMFLDISDMIYEYMPHLVKCFKKWPDMEKAIKEINGKIYTIPTFRGGPTSTTGIMHYRKDYFEKLGLEVPTTVDDFYNTCKEIKGSGLTQGYAPYCPYYKNLSQAEDFFFPAFGDAYQTGFADDGKGNIVFNRITEQYKRFLEFLNKLYKDELMENEYLSIDTSTISARVKSGQTCYCMYYSDLMPEDFLDGKMGIGCLEPLTSEFTNTKKVCGYSHILVAAGGLNKNTKYPEAILRMLDIAYSEDEVVPGTGLDGAALNNGIKGITYEIDEETNTQIYLTPEGMTDPFYSWLRKYHGWNAWYGVLTKMYFNSDVNAGARERSREASIRPYEKPRIYDNLFKHTDDENELINTKMTDITKYVEEMQAKFVTGITPFSEWDNFVKTVTDMGINEVIKAKQAGYDRWNN